MNVTVKYMAQARAAAGTSSETVALPDGATAATLFRQLAEKHGEALKALLLDGEGNPHPSILFVVGDEQVRLDDPRMLKADDVVSILTPISGG